MKNLSSSYTLSNGVNIPAVGFGTWQAPNGEVAVAAVEHALKVGYRHIDTAAIYGNEESVGQAIKNSGLPREELFITTKLWNADHGYEETLRAFDQSLARLGLDYLDLYLIHWPVPFEMRHCWEEKNAQSWRAFEELYEAGKIRALGLSNFMPHHIEALLKTAKIKPMLNQIKLHPGLLQAQAVEYCKKHDILLEAWSPLASGKIFENEQMKALSAKYNKSIAQICVRWCLEKGFLPLPKSVTAARIEENADVFDFTLSPEDVALLDTIKVEGSEVPDPDNRDF